MLKVEAINGEPPEFKKERVPFEDLTPYFPHERLILEREPDDVTTRVIDLIAPMGKGQRSLVVAAPHTGRSTILQRVAMAITQNNPEAILMVLMIDERPEDIVDMTRSVKAEVVSTNIEEAPARHVQVAEMAIEKGKRLVEHGRDVVVLLDGLNRLSRAYNATDDASGHKLPGGMDVVALHKPRSLLAAARCVEEGGSLTLMATVDPGEPGSVDRLIFDEVKHIGNHEIVLDSALVESRIYPAIDIHRSAARREETLLHPEEYDRVCMLRRQLENLGPAEAMEKLLGRLKETRSNAEFLLSLKS